MLPERTRQWYHLIPVLYRKMILHPQLPHPATHLDGAPRAGIIPLSPVIVPQPLRCIPQTGPRLHRLIKTPLHTALPMVCHLYKICPQLCSRHGVAATDPPPAHYLPGGSGYAADERHPPSCPVNDDQQVLPCLNNIGHHLRPALQRQHMYGCLHVSFLLLLHATHFQTCRFFGGAPFGHGRVSIFRHVSVVLHQLSVPRKYGLLRVFHRQKRPFHCNCTFNVIYQHKHMILRLLSPHPWL